MKYQIIDKQTGNVVGTYTSRKSAVRKADKLDLQYGAIRYGVKPVTPSLQVAFTITGLEVRQ